MTDISEAAKQKAQELLNADDPRLSDQGHTRLACWVQTALARYIQEVSDVAKELRKKSASIEHERFADIFALILPDDKPDPLVKVAHERMDHDAVGTNQQGIYDLASAAKVLSAELAERGYKIVKAGQ